MKSKTSKRAAITGVVLAAFLLSGCNRQEIIHYFNNTQEVSVENSAEITEAVDNGTEAHLEQNVLENSGAGTDTAGDTQTQQDPDSESDSKVVYNGPTVSLTMVGDILLHVPVEESCLQEDGTYNYDSLFMHVKKDIQAADLALVNQEVIIGGADLGISGYPSFNAPYEMGSALVNNGFDVVCHGTNHALDQGKKGITNCLGFWEKNYPDTAVLGIHKSQESYDNIYVYEQEGIKIAVLNYTYGTNGIALPSDMPYAVSLLQEEKVVSDLTKAEEAADFTVVCPHWGTEYNLSIDSQQKKWTNLFLKNGADLVLGTHPHVIEPVEWVEDEETGNKMLVYYSLGNFVNWTSSSGEGIANRMVGGMADVTIGMDEQGKAFIADYGITALVTQVEAGTGGVTTYKLSDYTDTLAEKNAIISQDADFSREYCTNLCDEVWGDIWE